MILRNGKTSDEMMIKKCVMKIKYMGIGLNDCFWHENEWEMKKILNGNGREMNDHEREWREVEESKRKGKKNP